MPAPRVEPAAIHSAPGTVAPDQTIPSPARLRPRVHTRWIVLAFILLALALLTLLPPLISVNRYGHRISTSISTSLGRPVHFDHVTLNLLPVPSFTITNFVVEEDPAFGYEPIIRANTVVATLRFRSLWRRRIEFAHISFAEPSLNLVHDRRGKWNFEAILLQAAQIETAPTAQRSSGTAPRFPYIEATGARVNLKQGPEKTPFSLSEADFALWLPSPSEWKMRVAGRPIRTDISTTDTGILQLEATLGRASSLETVPLNVGASWTGAPLGEASKLFLGRDAGLRGEVTLTADIHGNLSANAVKAHLAIGRLRRSDFVPEQPLSLDVDCSATATRSFHELAGLRCSLPIANANGATLALAGSVPDVLRPASADLEVGTSRLPASTLLHLLRIASVRIPPGLSATGLLSGSISHESQGHDRSDPMPAPTPTGLWSGAASIPDLTLSGDRLGTTPMVLGNLAVSLSSSPLPGAVAHRASPSGSTSPEKTASFGSSAPVRVFLAPLEIPLGGKEPAVLEGDADASGYSLHLSGMISPDRLAALAAALPQFGDGLALVLLPYRAGPVHSDPVHSDPAHSDPVRSDLLHSDPLRSDPVRLDLSAHRPWFSSQGLSSQGFGTQVWTDNLTHPAPARQPTRAQRRNR